MQNILQSRYYNINKREEGKYLVQTRSEAKSSDITLPEIHDTDKGINLNILPEKQDINLWKHPNQNVYLKLNLD